MVPVKDRCGSEKTEQHPEFNVKAIVVTHSCGRKKDHEGMCLCKKLDCRRKWWKNEREE